MILSSIVAIWLLLCIVLRYCKKARSHRKRTPRKSISDGNAGTSMEAIHIRFDVDSGFHRNIQEPVQPQLSDSSDTDPSVHAHTTYVASCCPLVGSHGLQCHHACSNFTGVMRVKILTTSDAPRVHVFISVIYLLLDV